MNKWGCGIAFKTSPQEHERFCGLYGPIGKPERWPTRKRAQAEVDSLTHYWLVRGGAGVLLGCRPGKGRL